LADFDAGHLPISIQSVILSRLDGLKEDWRQVLQAAAVIGRVFPKKVLKQAMPVQLELEKILWEMEGRGLVYQERAIPDEEYSFRHVLMQEVVYHNILRHRRKFLHQAVAEAIEKLYPDNLEEHYEALAYHHEKSGNIRQTIDYLFKAGEKASLNYANEIALNHFTRGLELLRSLPETPERHRQELSFLVALGVSLVHSRGHADDQVLETYTQALHLCQEAADSTHLYDILLELRRFALTSGHTKEALGYSQQMLELGVRHADSAEQARDYMMLSESLYYLADFSLEVWPKSSRHSVIGSTLLNDSDKE
jgi:predicted ATPase